MSRLFSSVNHREIGQELQVVVVDGVELDLAERQRVAEVQAVARATSAKMPRLRESKPSRRKASTWSNFVP